MITQLNRVQVIDQEFIHLQLYVTCIHEVEGQELTRNDIIKCMCGEFDKVLELSEAVHAACQILWTDELIARYEATLSV